MNEPLESYGLDSVMIVSMNRLLKPIFGQLSKTLFYEFDTLNALGEYLAAHYGDACQKWSGLKLTPEQSSTPAPAQKTQLQAQSAQSAQPASHQSQEPIAIIGLAGRYPGAQDIQAYWQNLKAGKDCITDIPPKRWSLDNFYEPVIDKAIAEGKSYLQCGGFIDGFADFDPIFFGISGRETHNMDPQERLFLTCSWQVLEDAGYTKASLQRKHQGRVGVFVGITKTGFNLYAPTLWAQGQGHVPRTSFSSVANRVSYLMNFSGPSLPIDTMCSSSLTAIHEACQHLKRNECEVAIAGGVNLYLHPSNYTELCSQRMLSPEGKCRSFGEGGNGFVPGEGVGAVLLKPCSQAKRDGDHIYALIKGSAINHGGKTSGYTVPSPNAQAQVIVEALTNAQVDPRTVSYIEAHGTGTQLGDPIEISGLTKAFEQKSDDPNISNDSQYGYCSIGSVKSNIGHLEAAAGIAGVSKIVLQMMHKQLVPSLHVQTINPNIDFEHTPFVVQRQLSTWQNPTLSVSGKRQQFPLTAGLSSFGAGGSNAHIILQQYQNNQSQTLDAHYPLIVLLSAKTVTELKTQAQNLRRHLERFATSYWDEQQLQRLCYTLQVGREAMPVRAITQVSDIDTLLARLEQLQTSNDETQASDWTLTPANQNQESLTI